MEALLGELECAICLGILDESCKVLPCQHTFCKRCLEDILHSKKELRCPECRILVDTKIDELPPNVLLMRILERMKNLSVPQPSTGTSTTTTSTAVLAADATKELGATKDSQAKAIFDYESSEVGDLSFKTGNILQLKRRIDKNWYLGELNGKTGVFPANHVQVIVPLPAALCKALYDFQMKEDEREGCLTFTRGTTIHVLRRVDQNWAEGRINNSIGIFPISFVELNPMAKQLLDFAVARSPRSDKTRTPPNPPGATPADASRKAEKPAQTPSKTLRTPGTGSVRGVQTFMQPCIALYPYEPQKPDEIELKKGCVYYVLEKCQDGWFKGMSRSFVPGVFPGNYVAMIKSREHFNSELQSDAQKSATTKPPTLPERDSNSKSRASTPTSTITTTTTTSTMETPPPSDEPKVTKDDSTIGLLKRFTKHALSTRPGPILARKSSGNEVENGTQPLHTRSGSCPSQLLQANPMRLVKETGFLSNRPTKSTEKSSTSHANHRPPNAADFSTTHYRHKKSFSLDSSSAANRVSGSGTKGERYRCIAPYPPSSDFELELKLGDTIMVSKKRENGWFKGQHERTGKVGLFPASFVVRVSE